MLDKIEVRDRIIHLLRIYHVVSPSMLQSGLGPTVPAAIWRPVLEEMISYQEVVRDSIVIPSPSGRHNSYTRLSLNGQLKKDLL